MQQEILKLVNTKELDPYIPFSTSIKFGQQEVGLSFLKTDDDIEFESEPVFKDGRWIAINGNHLISLIEVSFLLPVTDCQPQHKPIENRQNIARIIMGNTMKVIFNDEQIWTFNEKGQLIRISKNLNPGQEHRDADTEHYIVNQSQQPPLVYQEIFISTRGGNDSSAVGNPLLYNPLIPLPPADLNFENLFEKVREWSDQVLDLARSDNWQGKKLF